MNDALNYDIFADAGRAAQEPHGVDFLAGLKPQRVFATLHSPFDSRPTSIQFTRSTRFLTP